MGQALFQHFRHIQIAQFIDSLVVDKHVRAFQVTMQNFDVMQRLQTYMF